MARVHRRKIAGIDATKIFFSNFSFARLTTLLAAVNWASRRGKRPEYVHTTAGNGSAARGRQVR
jgi:hypothetical protein